MLDLEGWQATRPFRPRRRITCKKVTSSRAGLTSLELQWQLDEPNEGKILVELPQVQIC
jgi:hypothetical protein